MLRLPPYIGSAKKPSMVICSSALKNIALLKPGKFALPSSIVLSAAIRSLLGQPVEILAVGLAGEFVGGGDAGAEEFARIELELIAELGLGLGERPLAIEPRAAAVGAGELPVDEGRDAAIAAGRRQLVGRE